MRSNNRLQATAHKLSHGAGLRLLPHGVVSVLMTLVLGVLHCHGSTPTMTYESASTLTAEGVPINIGNHAVPRLVDWDADGILDLLVAGGDGYIWLFPQASPTNNTDFRGGSYVLDSGGPIRVGTGNTSVCIEDINGDGLPDLIASGNDDRLRFYSNTGEPGAPEFTTYSNAQGNGGVFTIPSSVGGRIEMADWDGDGLVDLLTGDYGGEITWYRNTGTAGMPVFGVPGVRMQLDGVVLHEPYNIHPRVFDFNNDGLLDLAYGINWGYVKILTNTDGSGITNFPHAYSLLNTDGADLNIRSLNGDDTTPDFADLNGDGTLDLISGGKNGKLFFIPGVAYTSSFESIERIMAAHTNDLGLALSTNSNLRASLFGLHLGLRNLTSGGILPISERRVVCDWYHTHIARHPQYLTKQHLDQEVHAYVPYLAGQTWVNLYESLPDSLQQRQESAATCGFTGTYSNLLVDLGMLFIDNSLASPASQQALYDIASAIPAKLQIVEVVTQNGNLAPPTGSGSINARTGVNVFSIQVGHHSEGFPPDVPDTRIDGFCAVVAHELNHNVDNAARRMYPWFLDRKLDLIEQAAPADLAFRDHRVEGFGLDLPTTQSNFLARGYWDGVAENWDDAYDAYWDSGAGAPYNRHWLRNNLTTCLNSPQEAFATLANQYFTSGDIMLQLALSRWDEGITSCINQLLFFADVYSLRSNETFFYRVNTTGLVTRSIIRLQRDSLNHICGLTTTNTHYEFLVDMEGNVLDILQAPLDSPIPDVNISMSGISPTGTVSVGMNPAPNFRVMFETCEDLRSGEWVARQTSDPFEKIEFWRDDAVHGSQRFYRLSRDW